jgi:hypothetical protein
MGAARQTQDESRSSPDMLVELPPLELARFIMCSVVPLTNACCLIGYLGIGLSVVPPLPDAHR